jgi:hypothetical protein
MKTFRVGDTVPFRVRIGGDPATDNPTAIIYDQANAAFGVPLTIGSGLTLVAGTKIVVGSFIPDAAGDWSVNVVDDSGLDVVKEIIVRDHSVESIGGNLGILDGKITVVDGKMDAQSLALAQILAATTSTGGGGHFG